MLKTFSTVLITIIVLALTAASSHASTSCPAPATGAFTACFYANLTLDGNPALVRTDNQIAFEWNNAPPDPSMPSAFSVRWQGYFPFSAGEAVFTAMTSDGMRVYVDGVNILDRWRDQPPYIYTMRPTLTSGTHLITVEYYESSGWGTAGLSWKQQAAAGQTPVIRSFSGTPAAIAAGQTATLSWNVSGASTVSLDNGIGDVSGAVSKPVSPARTTTYTLTATNGFGTVTSGSTITVNAAAALQQILLPGNVTVAPGDWIPYQVTLAAAAPAGGVFMTLSSSDPSIATFTPNYIFISEGMTTARSAPKVTGIQAGTAALTAAASALTTASAQVQVGPNPVTLPAPVINSFTASPLSITAGQSTTLSWNVAGAGLVSIDNGVGAVSSTAAKLLTPTQTTQYTLTAVNSGGSTLARATVTVTPVRTAQPPTTPVLVSAAAKSPAEIDLVWTASTSSSGITGYQIFRNGALGASVSGTSLSYADTSLAANTTYTYSVKAYDAAANYSIASNSLQATTPPATPGSTVVTSCQTITQSGHYVLGGNLSASPGSSCLTIRDTHDVYLDCQQHSVSIDRRTDPGIGSALAITNVNGYSVANCGIAALNTSVSATLPTLLVTGSPLGVLTNNVLSGGYISFDRSDHLQIAHNTSNAPIGISGSSQTIEYNTIVLVAGGYVGGAALTLIDSTGSVIRNNILDGAWDGVARQNYNLQPGVDDGILLVNVSNAIVQNNTIRNVWGAGIENVKPMVNVQLLNNQIFTAGISGIGGWYGNALNNVTIMSNTVTDSPRLFDFWRADGMYPGEQQVLFTDNTFSGNSLVRPRLSFATSGSGRLDFQNLPAGIPASAVVSARNKFTGNDFGPFGGGIRMLPASSFIDGGGNFCVPDMASNFPLRCTPPPPPAGGYYAIAASAMAPAVVAPGTGFMVLFSANPGGAGDYIGLAAVGADDQHWLSAQYTGSLVSNTLIFTAPAAAGQYELRYMKAGVGAHVAVSNPVTVGASPALGQIPTKP